MSHPDEKVRRATNQSHPVMSSLSNLQANRVFRAVFMCTLRTNTGCIKNVGVKCASISERFLAVFLELHFRQTEEFIGTCSNTVRYTVLYRHASFAFGLIYFYIV